MSINDSNKQSRSQKDDQNTSSNNSVTTKQTETQRSDSSTTNQIEATLNSTSESVAVQVAVNTKLDPSKLLSNAGKVGYGVYYFNEDEYITNQNTDPFISASVIKVFIMAYVYEKELALDGKIDGETIQELVRRMIQISDNQATNSLIEFLGIDTLNQYFEEQGYTDTRLHRKMLDEQARMNGLENYTSVKDSMKFLKKIYTHQSELPYSTMVEIMSAQTIKTKIPSKLPFEVTVANKTGELDTVENDIGLVLDSTKPFAIVILTNDVYNSSAIREAIGEFALQAFE